MVGVGAGVGADVGAGAEGSRVGRRTHHEWNGYGAVEGGDQEAC